ncbi:MAG: serine/threonine-protein kinase [Planctomycetota bacterium]
MNETEIFDRVVRERDPARQSDLLAELCGDDQPLKERVKKLLSAYEHPESFFEDPANLARDRAFDLTEDSNSDTIMHGTRIGPYKLLQEIGEGGMGRVYMAEQIEPVKRHVALKVIKPGMDSRRVIARFEAERQALAMMDHPNIAKVLDAGTTAQGYPYFVMELVNGRPITDYCDREKLATSQRLRLFIDVCRAVQHAHQKGVIHRDLKPSNIMVAEYDGKPVPKVIDFGVAKATGMQLTEKTLFTEFGQVIGTVEYMSPEQSRRNQLDVDTRSDIYSLGVVLYKLLTGETPFGHDRIRRAAWDEIAKIICEEDPPLPSVRIDSSASLSELAKQRNVGSAQLSSLVRGDLDWIVNKTLEKDRNRRYPSAGELADDIGRHLDQKPIVAGPQSSLYRFGKWVKRNRVGVGVLSGAGLVLVLFGVLAVRGYQETGQRSARVAAATQAAEFAMQRAIESPIGQEAYWETAKTHCERIRDAIADGTVKPATKKAATDVLNEFAFKKSERELAVQIENVVINGAPNTDLASWQKMEREMREFFRKHGFDLDREDPALIGKRIRDHRSKVMWADLLELWIGTLGHMQSIGGPKLSGAEIEGWADAIYVADDDPLRTGIRKFIYQSTHDRKLLDDLVEGVDVTSHSARTLSWLASCYSMVGAHDECDRLFRFALDRYPRDVMLAHDYGYALYHQQRYQEAARMYHRCLTLKDTVPGLWKSLARTLKKLGEKEAADRASAKAAMFESRNGLGM